MEELNLDIIRGVQTLSSPVLNILAELVTMLGEKVLLSVLFCFIYWCVDKRWGRYLILTLSASVALNGVLKDLFRVQRPIGAPGVVSRRLQTASGYSFPSGHSQSAAAFWTGAALWRNKPAFRWVCVALILGVGISRIYLGVHYPTDVLAGLLLGAGVAVLFYRLTETGRNKTAFGIVIALGAAALLTGESNDTIYAGCMVAGLLAGTWFERRYVNFTVEGGLLRRAGRFLLGCTVIGVLYLLPRLIFPGVFWIKALDMGLLVFVGLGALPWFFSRIGL